MKLEDLSANHRLRLQETLDLQVRPDGGLSVRGEVRDLNDAWVLVGFPIDIAPCLELGRKATLLFQAPAHGLLASVPAFVSERRENAAVRLYRFRFQQGGDSFHNFVVQALRRTSRWTRVRPVSTLPIQVELLGIEQALLVVGRLEDISATGFAVSLDLEFDTLLRDLMRVRAALTLPAGERLDLPCSIRQRLLLEKVVQYGLRIDCRNKEEVQVQTNIIQAYIRSIQKTSAA